jgi:monofunctional biosynthetic peptidoglycan transglycosylase
MIFMMILMLAGDPESQAIDPRHPVFRFDTATPAWPSINDGVMGGLSSGRMWMEEGIAVFGGSLSMENNGGFSSVRSRPMEHHLEGKKGLVLRVRGDGRNYGIRLRTNDGFDGPSYQADLPTRAGEWIEVRVPFNSFRPTFRGRPVPGYPELDPAGIRTFGLILADKQPGDFRLELDWIEAY